MGGTCRSAFNQTHLQRTALGTGAGRGDGNGKVTVYGLPIVAARKVNYSQIDPALCRELFIRHALVEGDWQTRHAFFRENLKLRAEVEELEHKLVAAIFWWMTKRCLSSTTSASATM